MLRYDIINQYIDKYNYESYVEIGTQNSVSFNSVKCSNKVGVDPDPKAGATFCMTSDKFFKGLSKGVKHDIYFLDGLHESPQLYKDITNALNHLSDNGTIVCHDCNPLTYEANAVPRIQKLWNGDVWKDVVRIRKERDDIEVFTVDTDHGCCVIRKGKSKKLVVKDNPTYKDFDKNRNKWLNLISVKEFLKKIGVKTSVVNNYKVYQFQPYAIDGNYGAEIEHYVNLVPNDDDWIIISDYDVMCLTPHHIHKVREYINAYPDTGMFLPFVNRVKQFKQVYDMKLFDNPDVKVHQKLAVELSKKPISVTELNIVISGYFMIFKKSTYKKIVPPSGLLGCDNKISKRILNLGMKIRMMDTMYCFHYYRMNAGVNDKSHLKNIPQNNV